MTRLAAAAVSVVLMSGLVACGDDGGLTAGSPAEFCALLRQADASGDVMNDDPAAALAAFGGLRDAAPTPEVRAALSTLYDTIEQLSKLDENDPDAMSTAFEMMFTPEFIAAGETLEQYAEEECGLSLSDDGTDSGSDSGSGTESGSGDPGMGDSGSIFDDLDAGDISDGVDAILEMAAPDYSVASSQMSSAMDHTEVEVQLRGEGDIDALAICEEIDSWLATMTTDTAIALRITVEGSDTPIAGHGNGEPCRAG